MGICRIEEVHFGVTDIPECVRFFSDFGLTQTEDDGSAAVFSTPAGQRLVLHSADASGLPAALEDGSTVREVIWGVDDAESLRALGEELARDRDVDADVDGGLHTTDNTGYGLGLRVAAPRPAQAEEIRANVSGAVRRWNEPLTRGGQARPLRICHVALFIPETGHERAVAFYTDRLGFRPTDQLLDMGTFMQCEGDDDQHNLLLAHRADRTGINHVAYEVRNHMVRAGWREARRLGRHTIGSNVFRFFVAPCGGRVEYAADMDRVDDSYGPNVYEQRPPHHLWMLTTNGDKEAE
jgi:catechol 2,3-dioxygenase-like lactoylglutathione lyase family enzyme